jgi:predicted RNA methylase
MATNAQSARPLNSSANDKFLAAARPADYRRIREVLAAADYTDKGITQVLGVDTLNRLGERKLPVLLRRVSGKRPLETLIRLFILGEPVDVGTAARAFAPMPVDEWVHIGLVSQNGSQVQPAVQLRCYQGMVIAYDFIRRGPGGLQREYVMGVSPSSLVLASMTVRRGIRSALDLGTGCGIQAFLAASHSERVVGVDCNARALAVSRFNTYLNGISNVQFRNGNMFDPVAGETFDLIVSNPPFIISPDNRHFFLNSGMDSDDVCRRIVKEAPAFLNEGGYCVFNANWAVVDGEDWRARLADWFEGTGCDGLVILQGVQDLGEYAASLIEVGSNEQAEYLRHFNEWMDYYGAHRMTGIGQGVIIMRRASQRRNWFAVGDTPQNVAFPSGGDVERLVELQTFLHSLTHDDDLLEHCLKLAPNVRLEQTHEFVDGSWRQISGRLYRIGGLEYSGLLDGPSAAALTHFNGLRPLRECLMQLAGALNADPSVFIPAALALVRRLIEQGFVLPAEL